MLGINHWIAEPFEMKAYTRNNSTFQPAAQSPENHLRKASISQAKTIQSKNKKAVEIQRMADQRVRRADSPIQPKGDSNSRSCGSEQPMQLAAILDIASRRVIDAHADISAIYKNIINATPTGPSQQYPGNDEYDGLLRTYVLNGDEYEIAAALFTGTDPAELNHNHDLSDGPEGTPVSIQIPDSAIKDGKTVSDTYEGSLRALVESGILQAKTYGPQSTNNYTRKGKKYQVTYNRTSKGSINFGTWHSVTPLDGGTWTNPETAHNQNILINLGGTDWIDLVTSGKRVYKWKGNEKNRSVHFRAANVKQGVAGSGQPSPGITWHHQQSPRGGMIGVEHEVHKRHGHNGGVALW